MDNDVKVVHIISTIYSKTPELNKIHFRTKIPLAKNYRKVGQETCRALKITLRNNKHIILK